MNETIAGHHGPVEHPQTEQKQVPEELLQVILEAGRSAQRGGNIQTSHLLVIQSQQVVRE